MSRHSVVVSLGAAIGLVLAVFGAACSGSAKDGTGSPTVGRTGSLLPSSPTALPTFDPAKFQALLSELRGRPVVVNIWGSWCGPCRREAPDLASASQAHRGEVQFIGIDVLDQLSPARNFIREFGWTYPSVFDQTASIENAMGLIGQPQTLVYDAAGKRSFVWSGPISRQILEQEIVAALHRGTGSSYSPPA
jgi:thiol-disulfide isomerase/thioredoxin